MSHAPAPRPTAPRPAPTALPLATPSPAALLASALLLAGLALLLGASAATAHTELAASTPAADAAVADPPSQVVLEFTSALQPGAEVAVEVVDPAGDDLVAAPPAVEGLTVTVPLNLAVNPGEHAVRWAVTAADGDRITDGFAFTFDPPQDVRTPAPATDPAEVLETEPAATADDTTAGPTAPSDPGPTASPSPGPALDAGLTEDDGSPLAGILVAVLAVAALAAVLVLRLRGGAVDRPGGLRDADQDR